MRIDNLEGELSTQFWFARLAGRSLRSPRLAPRQAELLTKLNRNGRQAGSLSTLYTDHFLDRSPCVSGCDRIGRRNPRGQI
jgi:hypothetical protein